MFQSIQNVIESYNSFFINEGKLVSS